MLLLYYLMNKESVTIAFYKKQIHQKKIKVAISYSCCPNLSLLLGQIKKENIINW